jgi:hypothetical protein
MGSLPLWIFDVNRREQVLFIDDAYAIVTLLSPAVPMDRQRENKSGIGARSPFHFLFFPKSEFVVLPSAQSFNGDAVTDSFQREMNW